jgi:hypothetical protein
MKTLLKIFLLSLVLSVNANDKTQWVEIGEGTYEYGFTYPYKLKMSVPFGVRDIEDIKQGLLPIKFNIQWLPINYSQEQVKKLFNDQFKNSYDSKESYILAKNIINYFLSKLPATKKHDEWVFTYFPDEGSKLYIDNKKIHQLVGAELNRALIQSWLNKSPVLTANLFNRLLKVQR